MLVNYAGSRPLRPHAVTKIGNMFLASDYVLTHTELATMEGANEAARRAVNGILALSPGSAADCAVKPFDEPLQFLRNWDQRRLDGKKNWNFGWGKTLLSIGTHVAVAGCRTLVAAKNLLSGATVPPADLSRSSPLRAPGPADPATTTA